MWDLPHNAQFCHCFGLGKFVCFCLAQLGWFRHVFLSFVCLFLLNWYDDVVLNLPSFLFVSFFSLTFLVSFGYFILFGVMILISFLLCVSFFCVFVSFVCLLNLFVVCCCLFFTRCDDIDMDLSFFLPLLNHLYCQLEIRNLAHRRF